MIQRPDYARVPWWWIGGSALLTVVGLLFVTSATQDAVGDRWLTRESTAQMLWWGLGAAACVLAMHISPASWRRFSIPAGLAGCALMLMMLVCAGLLPSLVPTIKGQANWIALGSVRIQPVELVKLATLLACATFASAPNFDARRLHHCAVVLLVAAIPALIIAKEDLGSAITFVPMALGVLLVAGMRLRHLALVAVAVLGVGYAAYQILPREGPKAYQWRRIDAFVHPDRYTLTEGYQIERAKRSIGSGQWTGKGYMQGEQNRLGLVPEKHTDMVFAVIGEEVGFLGSAGFIVLLMAWCGTGLVAAARAPGPWSRIYAGGFTCLIAGQASINLAVAMGLMPVTGVTLPFVSYGGSSLIACWLGLGIACAGVAGEKET